MKTLFKKLNKYLFIVALIAFAVTFFMRNNYRGVTDIDSRVLNNPIQSEVKNKDIIKFTKDDYAYELTPLYDYEVNGLIVHKMDYRWFSIYKRDSVFPMDLCLLWGENAKTKVYQNKSLEFRQDFRFCLWHYFGDLKVNNNEVANVHLLLNNESLEKKLETLSTGDQVQVRGKLVNVSAENIGEPGKYDPQNFTMNSSTQRDDAGGGACEVLYVEDLKIIKKGNPLANLIYIISYYVIIALIAINILWFFISTTWGYRKYSKVK